MAGYILLERKMLQPQKADGIIPNEPELGFLDYLRELRQEIFPFARGAKLRVVGVEDVLLDAGKNRGEVSAEVHRLLATRANDLERMSGFVQIVFQWQLHFGQELWFERGLERISLRPLFGNVRPMHEGTNVYYIAGFNLT